MVQTPVTLPEITMHWSLDTASKVVLSHEELALLLGGIELAGSKRRAWFRRVVGEASEPTIAAKIFAANKT
jgi:hypothetical protein